MVHAPQTGEDVDLVPVASGWVGIRRVFTTSLLSSSGQTPPPLLVDSTPSPTQQAIASAAAELTTRCADATCSGQLAYALAAAGVSTDGAISSLAALGPVVSSRPFASAGASVDGLTYLGARAPGA